MNLPIIIVVVFFQVSIEWELVLGEWAQSMGHRAKGKGRMKYD